MVKVNSWYDLATIIEPVPIDQEPAVDTEHGVYQPFHHFSKYYNERFPDKASSQLTTGDDVSENPFDSSKA